MNDGASDGDALHLAAGEFIRKMRGAFGEADAREHFIDALANFVRRPFRQRQRERHVLEDVERRNEIEELKNESEPGAAQ